MTKKYILDLTNAKLPDYYPAVPLMLPLVEGRWYKDFDVDEDAVPGLRGRMKMALKKQFPDMDVSKYLCMPYGMDRGCWPEGAELIEL